MGAERAKSSGFTCWIFKVFDMLIFFSLQLVPPVGMLSNPMNAVTTKFVRTSTNKVKCPVFVVRVRDYLACFQFLSHFIAIISLTYLFDQISNMYIYFYHLLTSQCLFLPWFILGHPWWIDSPNLIGSPVFYLFPVDPRGQEIGHWGLQWGVHFVERPHLQLWDHFTGKYQNYRWPV